MVLSYLRLHWIQSIEQKINKPKQKDENLVLPKEYVENANLYQPVLNKIMTTRELQL